MTVCYIGISQSVSYNTWVTVLTGDKAQANSRLSKNTNSIGQKCTWHIWAAGIGCSTEKFCKTNSNLVTETHNWCNKAVFTWHTLHSRFVIHYTSLYCSSWLTCTIGVLWGLYQHATVNVHQTPRLSEQNPAAPA